jgi:hypothetical protein
MELYFGSLKQSGSEIVNRNMVMFTIPDIGVEFKAPFAAEDLTLDYAALLTLLEFIDVNPQLFANRALELFCNNVDLVHQINNSIVEDARLVPLLSKALEYRRRLKYSINWVPEPDNPAQQPEID